MTASAHWAWHNLQNGLAVGEAAKLEAAFFQGSAPIELYRDVFYCAAGIYIHIQVAAQQRKLQPVTCCALIYLATHVDMAVFPPLAQHPRRIPPTISRDMQLSDAFACRHYPALRFACRGVQEV